VDVTEERRLVGGHGLDYLPAQSPRTPGPEAAQEVPHRGQTFVPGERGQARLRQVSLAPLQHDGRLLVHEAAQVVKILRSQRRASSFLPFTGGTRTAAYRNTRGERGSPVEGQPPALADPAGDLGAYLVQGQNFVGQAGPGDKPGHAPDDATCLVPHEDTT